MRGDLIAYLSHVLLAAFSQTACSSGTDNSAKTSKSTMSANRGSPLPKIANIVQIDVNAICTSFFIPNSSICGAIISTGHTEIQINSSQRTNRSVLKLRQSNWSIPVMTPDSTDYRSDFEGFPFTFTKWPEVLSGPCPSHHDKKSHKGINAGHSHSHYQVWMDFIYFDHDVLEAVKRKEVKGFYNSTAWTSTGGTFSASETGVLRKNNLLFTEDDIIVIIEDEALVSVRNVGEIMRNEFSNMTTDLLVLGWRDTRPVHDLLASSFAYALTRRGARIAVKYFDPCGHNLDLQLSTMARHGRLSHRSLNYLSEDITKAGLGTRGIFVRRNRSAKVA